MNINALVQQLIVLFTIILLGFAAMRAGFLPKSTNQVLSGLVLNLSNPCAVLASVLTGQRTLEMGQVFLLTAVAVGLHLFLILLATFFPKLLRVPKDQEALYRFMTVFGNMSFLGFPVITALFGQSALFLAAIFVLVFHLFCYTYGVALLRKPGEPLRWKRILSPMVIASVAAYILYLMGAQVPALVVDILDTMGSLTSPAAMVAIGCALALQPLGKIFRQPRIYLFAILRLTLVPLAVWALCFWWMKDPLMLGVTVAISAMPVAINAELLATQYGADEGLAASGVFISTILSLVTLPAVMWLLF